MPQYELKIAQDKHFYNCLPEIIIYDEQSKQTTLLSSCAAKIMQLFFYDLKKHPISEAELKQYCCQDDNYAVEDFGQSLDQLLLMKMIESVE